MFKKEIFLIFSLLFFSIFFPFPLFAQFKAQSVTISPLVFDLSAHPGEEITNQLRVYNPGDESIHILMTIENFKPVGEIGSVEITEFDSEIYSLAKWVEVEPIEFDLNPREEKFVNFKIKVPKNAEPGGKYFSLVVNISSLVGPTTTGAQVLQKVASLILLSIPGEVKEKLVLLEFKGPVFQEYGPITFSLRLENQGNVHLRPKGMVAITNWRNQKIADLSIPQSVVMPQAKRVINIEWPKRNLIGRFTATLVGSYGKTNEPFNASWTFWVWPWKISLLILIVIILILILIIRGRKRIKTALKILFKGES